MLRVRCDVLPITGTKTALPDLPSEGEDEMKIETEIKNLVASAIRILDGDGWSPLCGGEWTAMNGAIVIINKPTRFCVKPSYRVVHPLFGVWIGYLNGSSGRNVGKAAQTMTAEQMDAERAYDPQNSIAAALAA